MRRRRLDDFTSFDNSDDLHDSDDEISRFSENADLNWSFRGRSKFHPIPEREPFKRKEYEDLTLDEAARLITPTFRAELPLDELSMSCSSSTVDLNADYLDRQFVEMGGQLSDSDASSCMMSDMEESKRKPIAARSTRKEPSVSPSRRQSIVRFAEMPGRTSEHRRTRGSEIVRRRSSREIRGDRLAESERIRASAFC
jgi:hypothetical protein